MIVVDSNLFIAFFRDSDGLHSRAIELLSELRAKKQALLTTTHVIDEVVTFIRSKDGSDTAFDCAQLLLKADNISLETVVKPDLVLAAEVLRKYKKLSLCDSLNVVLARKHGLKQIASFDAGFDHVEKIERIY